MAALAARWTPSNPVPTCAWHLRPVLTTIIRRGLGHSGLALGALFEAWAGALGDEHRVTPLVARRMLAASLTPVASSIEWSDALVEMLGGAVRELHEMGDTLPEVEDVFSRFSTQAQIGLVEATNEATGRIDRVALSLPWSSRASMLPCATMPASCSPSRRCLPTWLSVTREP